MELYPFNILTATHEIRFQVPYLPFKIYQVSLSETQDMVKATEDRYTAVHEWKELDMTELIEQQITVYGTHT